jgi:hypothetical protein
VSGYKIGDCNVCGGHGWIHPFQEMVDGKDPRPCSCSAGARLIGGTIATISASEFSEAIQKAKDDGRLVEACRRSPSPWPGVKATWDADGQLLRVEKA